MDKSIYRCLSLEKIFQLFQERGWIKTSKQDVTYSTWGRHNTYSHFFLHILLEPESFYYSQKLAEAVEKFLRIEAMSEDSFLEYIINTNGFSYPLAATVIKSWENGATYFLREIAKRKFQEGLADKDKKDLFFDHLDVLKEPNVQEEIMGLCGLLEEVSFIIEDPLALEALSTLKTSRQIDRPQDILYLRQAENFFPATANLTFPLIETRERCFRSGLVSLFPAPSTLWIWVVTEGDKILYHQPYTPKFSSTPAPYSK
jgi:hypothetical protein